MVTPYLCITRDCKITSAKYSGELEQLECPYGLKATKAIVYNVLYIFKWKIGTEVYRVYDKYKLFNALRKNDWHNDCFYNWIGFLD